MPLRTTTHFSADEIKRNSKSAIYVFGGNEDHMSNRMGQPSDGGQAKETYGSRNTAPIISMECTNEQTRKEYHDQIKKNILEAHKNGLDIVMPVDKNGESTIGTGIAAGSPNAKSAKKLAEEIAEEIREMDKKGIPKPRISKEEAMNRFHKQMNELQENVSNPGQSQNAPVKQQGPQHRGNYSQDILDSNTIHDNTPNESALSEKDQKHNDEVRKKHASNIIGHIRKHYKEFDFEKASGDQILAKYKKACERSAFETKSKLNGQPCEYQEKYDLNTQPGSGIDANNIKEISQQLAKEKGGYKNISRDGKDEHNFRISCCSGMSESKVQKFLAEKKKDPEEKKWVTEKEKEGNGVKQKIGNAIISGEKAVVDPVLSNMKKYIKKGVVMTETDPNSRNQEVGSKTSSLHENSQEAIQNRNKPMEDGISKVFSSQQKQSDLGEGIHGTHYTPIARDTPKNQQHAKATAK